MTVETYERTDTIKASIEYKDDTGAYIDPSGNKAFITVIKPDGSYLIGNGSGATASRTDTGKYEYYFCTSDTDPLGLYIVQWNAFEYIGPVGGIDYGYKKLTQRDVVRITEVEQES